MSIWRGMLFFFSSRRRHTRFDCDWSSDVCSSDLANGDPTNDEPAEAPGSHDRSKPRAYHGGDLLGIQNHLPYLKDLGVTALWLTPIVKNGAMQDRSEERRVGKECRWGWWQEKEE